MYYIKKRLNKQKTGKLIMEAISKTKYSYDDISILLELTSSRVIYDWISGKKLPGIENLLNLSLILNKQVEELLYLE